MVDKEWIRKNILELNDNEIERIEKGRVTDKLIEMKLEGVQLPESNDLNFGDEGSEGGGDMGGDMGGGDAGGLFGGDTGGDMGGGDMGGGDMGGLFAGEIKKGQLMSEEELDEYDDLIDGLDEDEDNEQKNIWGEKLVPIKARQQAKMSGKGEEHSMEPKRTWAHGGALTLDKPISAKDLNPSLMDGIMPQSSVISKHIDKQLSYRISKDLESMGSALNIGISNNKLLKEDNDQEYDILIDDNFLNKEDEG